MPVFPTPDPVELRVRTGGGSVTVTASSRADTEVDVQPADPARQADVELAAATRVEASDGVVVVDSPDDRRTWRLGRPPAIAVRVALPEGSSVRITASSADVTARGRLGAAVVKTASGDVELEDTDDATVETASGDIAARNVAGSARIATASGDVSVGDVDGDADLGSASGDIEVGRVGGDLRVKTASGDATVAAVEGSVSAKTASGDARVDHVRRGIVTVDSASGDVGIGIAPGTAAWLDVQSLSGRVSSTLDDAEAPGDGDETVRVRARTLSGDIAITRAG